LYAEELDGRACLQKGRDDLDNKKYEDAVCNLSKAEKEFPLLGDYALLWLSDAYHESGEHKESLKTISNFLKKYPHSSLTKKVRAAEIREAAEISENNIQLLYDSYLKDYPGDTEMKYLYAGWLKMNGQKDKAKALFKDIYVDACAFSGMAYHELSPADIGVEDLVKRASSLTKLMEYKAAESLLRSLMTTDDGKMKTEILNELGLSLFRQKRYREAAEVYRKAGERYWEVRSLYRAGEKDKIDASLDDLLDSGEKRFSSILMAVASDKRREGKTDEALRIYQAVKEKFPSETEDALWGSGWTFFLAGDYQRASEIFDRLYNGYNDSKYLYWKARSIEAGGQGALKNYRLASGQRRSFYSIMLSARTGESPEKSSTGEARKFIKPMTAGKKTPLVYKKIERVEALLALGLLKEALSEMVHISKNTGSVDDMLYLCSKFQELGEYKLSVRAALKVPYTDELLDFLYPFAYRDVVESVSAKYSVDPLLVLSIAREESRFDTEARSPAGAIGLMQLMPNTASRLDGKLKLNIKGPHDLLDVKNNLQIGAYYLNHLVKEFGSYPYAIAAYNAGEEIVKKWIQRGNYRSADEFIEDIPYEETRNYVKRVIATFFEYKRASQTEGEIMEIPLEKL
jgi:soluble lytic murein transglycosylase